MPTGACQLKTRCCSKEAAREKRQVHPLAAFTGDLAEGRVAGKQLIDGQAVVDAQSVQRRGSGPGIGGLAVQTEHLLQAGQQVEAMGRRPMGHRLGKASSISA